MKANVIYSLSVRSEVIDLADYDVEPDVKFEDLPEIDRNEIADYLRNDVVVYVDIKTIPE